MERDRVLTSSLWTLDKASAGQFFSQRRQGAKQESLPSFRFSAPLRETSLHLILDSELQYRRQNGDLHNLAPEE
jgi:hypothetical protein